MISESTRDLLRDALAQMSAPVTLHLFTGEGAVSAGARGHASEIAALAPKVTLEEHDVVRDAEAAARFGIEHAPALAVVSDRDRGIRVYGAPGGYEFMTLVDTILMVSSGDSGLSPASRARLAALAGPRDVLVFVTPTCASCPRAVSLAHRAAFECDLVTAAAVVATEFPDLVREHHVTGVPKIVVNGTVEILGAVEEEELIERLVG